MTLLFSGIQDIANMSAKTSSSLSLVVVIAWLGLITLGAEEAEALLHWKSSLHFQSLSSWSPNKTTCLWIGISCNGAGSVTRINLSNFTLHGSLHSFNFSSFPSLTHLNLSSNNLTENIPTLIGTLSKLTMLDLSINQLSGSIPQEIGTLSKLTFLDLSINQLLGPIPKEICNLTNLAELWIHDNLLMGPIPSNIKNMVHLAYLMLFNNQISGSIPEEVGMLESLTGLNLYTNRLVGRIPPS
ncbi:putative leucine-rich repeat receptor-like protein kinase [Cinnamomum micranthum f. kanehirae]|uniref:Putative leucine-rich repeat receptor-like protein kinase n=1 Tax=Cinnamomum micranthum f. kanehirae TaxID=337451 RepID=A0A443Q0R1_9MAGN|nr:putative leucine-rich repeat receptor-like protein kinase [Cinnamomum micranthum f. kanehirae]